MRVSLIAALDRHRAIGRDNDLPWRLPDDLKRLKALTLGKPVLMGRRTAEAIGRALPGRLNLVMTRSGRTPFADMRAVGSLDDALRAAGDAGAGELCVIGGAEIYALALPHAQVLHATEVETEVDGAVGLAQKIVESGKAHACLARNYFRFTFARMEDWNIDEDYTQTSRDGCVLERLRRAVDKNGNLRNMIREVAMAPEFQQRLIVQ